jgi:hypothetical protein
LVGGDFDLARHQSQVHWALVSFLRRY